MAILHSEDISMTFAQSSGGFFGVGGLYVFELALAIGEFSDDSIQINTKFKSSTKVDKFKIVNVSTENAQIEGQTSN